MKLQSIAKEAAACRAAWAAMPGAKAGVHIHHEIAVEALTEPIENRIAYILREKPKKEQALRLRLMRPVEAPALAEYQRVTAPALAEYQRVTAPALAEYQRVTAPALAEYLRVKASAWAEYLRVEAPALAEYERVEAAAHLAICVSDCPFYGRTIFGEAPK
jgi:hypothetical protein